MSAKYSSASGQESDWQFCDRVRVMHTIVLVDILWVSVLSVAKMEPLRSTYSYLQVLVFLGEELDKTCKQMMFYAIYLWSGQFLQSLELRDVKWPGAL